MKVSVISGRVSKNIKRISMVRPNASGGPVRQILVRDDEDPGEVMKVTVVRPGLGVVKRLRVEELSTGRKKQSGLLRPMEKGIRKLVLREVEIASDYLARHERSNRRKSNGWIKDLPRNVSRAIRSES